MQNKMFQIRIAVTVALSCAGMATAGGAPKMVMDEVMHVYDACMGDEAMKTLAAENANRLCMDASKLLLIKIGDEAAKYFTGYGVPITVTAGYSFALFQEVKEFGLQQVNMLQQCVLLHYAKHYNDLQEAVKEIGSTNAPDWVKKAQKDATKLKGEVEKLQAEVDKYAKVIGFSFAKLANPSEATKHEAEIAKLKLPAGFTAPDTKELGLIDRGCQRLCGVLASVAKTVQRPAIAIFRGFTKFMMAQKVAPAAALPNLAAIKELAENKCVQFKDGAATKKVPIATALDGYGKALEAAPDKKLGETTTFKHIVSLSPLQVAAGANAKSSGSTETGSPECDTLGVD